MTRSTPMPIDLTAPGTRPKRDPFEFHRKDGKMNIVVPMAGAGSRFSQAGYGLPKPLIHAFGEPMYRHAIRSLPLHRADRFICIIRSDDYSAALRNDIENQFHRYHPIVVEIDHVTRGQAESVLYAKDHIALDRAILIHNADSAFTLRHTDEFPPKFADGTLLLFRGTGPNWSYAAMDAQGRVREVREKDPISPFASTGTYYFRSTAQLLDLIVDSMQGGNTVNGEYYIGPLYNRMVADGSVVNGCEVERFVNFGTPEDLVASEANESDRDMIRRLGAHMSPFVGTSAPEN
jgi:UDP-N-acetylglucosamine diphosphorylase / glucose-1-phosphate thymidylyltransferase / UDP-N-acetylgalactosamine diphosphorylase / glucosamine-1-phosphate N-acetyltransferase / galactosamine-1-phosphate N-acetyltransferase